MFHSDINDVCQSFQYLILCVLLILADEMSYECQYDSSQVVDLVTAKLKCYVQVIILTKEKTSH